LENYKYVGKIKDVNDFILNNTEGICKLSLDMILPYFTNKHFDIISFLT